MRDQRTYSRDVAKNDLKSTGIKSDSIFHVLKHYHCTENVNCDVMHDLLLGVFRCDMALLLNKILQQTSLNLEELNDRLRCFDFGVDDNPLF